MKVGVSGMVSGLQEVVNVVAIAVVVEKIESVAGEHIVAVAGKTVPVAVVVVA